MRVRVTFRVNPHSGQVELFQVDNAGQERLPVEHDATHERIARAIADVIDPRADVIEDVGLAVPLRPDRLVPSPEVEQPLIRRGRAEQTDG